MKIIENVKGSGGKGGGGYRAPVEAPNTLQSQQEVTIIEAVSEGPIVGLVNADQGIALNYTPLRTPGGALTYNGITWGNKLGGPDQSAFPDVAGAETETPVNIEITKLYPRAVGPDSGAVVRQVTNTNCTHVRITLSVQGLYEQILDDDERAGDTVGQTLSYSIVIKNVLDEVIISYIGSRTDKTMSAAQWAHKFKLDNQGPWFITITKLYDDNEAANIRNDIYWSSFTEIVSYRMIYPHTAVMLIRGSAETFGSSVPSRQYNIKGLIVEVPSNYNPETRAYTGIWDGTFINAWTDNPAWVLRDVIENDRYGLKKYFAAAVQNVELCDKWTLYEIAKVCDELVPDGYGGTEPRYTFNGQILGEGEAKEVIQAIASIFHGMTYWGCGKLFAVSDFPTDPIRTLNQTQVIEGRLTYSTGSAQELHSVALVTWYDPNDYGRSRVEVVFNWDMFDKVGYRAVQVTAYGCTSRGQAYRQGLWTLLTEEEQWQCSCETGLDTYDLMPGNVIQVADPIMMGTRFSGRYVTISETTITLDAPVILAANETYTLRLIADDGTEESRIITSRGTSAVVTVNAAFTKTFVKHAAWSIAGSDAAPKTFAIRSIKEQETGRLMLSLREVLADKYDRLESSIAFTATPGASPIKNVIAAPTGLIVTAATFITDGGLLTQRLSFSWATVMDTLLSAYEVQYQSPAGDWTTLTGLTVNNVDVTNALLGKWTFKVRAIAIDGRSSAWATTIHILEGSATIPLAPTGLTATGWFGDIMLEWQIPDDAMYYYTEVYECSINDRESAVFVGRNYGNRLTRHVGSWVGRYYWVRCIGKNGVASDWNADSGTYGESDQASHQDFVDLVLQENPYLAEVQTDLNTAITLVDTNIKTIDLPDYEQRLANRINKINIDVQGELAKVSDAVTDALGNTYELDKKVRDAGIVVDPDDGTVRIWGLDQANGRISNVEINLDAVESTLIEKASVVDVNAALAIASTELYAHINDGLNAEAGERILLAAQVAGNTSAIQTESATRASADSAMASQITTLVSDVSGNTSGIQTEATTRANADDALSSAISTVSAVANAKNKTYSQASAPTTGMTAGDLWFDGDDSNKPYRYSGSAWVATADTRIAANTAAIQTEQTARANADSAMASQITTLQTTVGNNTSAIQTEATARANADSALSNTISTVSATANAKNKTYSQASAPTSGMTAGDLWFDSDDSNKPYRYSGSAWVATEDTRIAANTAAIQSETTARTNADNAMASTISTVSAVANAKNKTYSQASAPTTGMTAGDLWFDSDDSNKPYRYSGSAWVATADTRIAANTAAIQSETTARTNADSAIASNVTTLQTTTVGGTVTESASAPSSPTAGQVYYNTTSKKYFQWSGSAWVEVKGIEGHSRSAIQIINESVDGIKGKHAVKIDTNGYVTGYELIGTGASSSMVFHVDNFLVGKPGTTNKYPFVIGTVDGVSRVSMDSAFIQDLAISSAKIANAAISNAKIANATISRLKIEGHTLTEIGAVYNSGATTVQDAYTDVDTITISTESGYPAPIFWAAHYVPGGDGDVNLGVRLLRGSTVLFTQDPLAAGGTWDAMLFFVDTGVPTGSTTYKIQAKRSRINYSPQLSSRRLSVHYAYR